MVLVSVWMTCAQCYHQWLDSLGQFAQHYHGCPKCESKYWRADVSQDALNELGKEGNE